jgi:tetratricopeptide (TPR) repeat protein
MRLRNKLLFPLFLTALLIAAAPGLAQDAGSPAVGDDPEAPAPVARADLGAVNELVRQGSYPEAETALALLQEEFPDEVRVLLLRGEVLLALRRFDEALPPLRRCAELDPDRERIHFQLATALQVTGDLPGAIEAYGKEIELNDATDVKVMAHLNRSLLLEQERDWAAAARELEAVLLLEPGRVEAYGDIASLYIKAGEIDTAAERLNAGLGAGFRSARHMYSLGAQYLKNKSYDPASQAFRIALKIDPDYADATRNLAVALEQMGQEDEAVEQYRRYLELRPDAEDAAEITEQIRAAEGG